MFKQGALSNSCSKKTNSGKVALNSNKKRYEILTKLEYCISSIAGWWKANNGRKKGGIEWFHSENHRGEGNVLRLNKVGPQTSKTEQYSKLYLYEAR